MKTSKIILIALALLTAAPAAARDAQPAPASMTVAEAIACLNALRALDGHQVLAKVNGQDAVVVQPYRFGSGAVRLAIANDIAALERVFQASEAVRVGIVKEIASRRGGKPIAPGTPEFEEFQRQYGEALRAKASGLDAVARIKAADLKLDENEIPPSVVSALLPILDQ